MNTVELQESYGVRILRGLTRGVLSELARRIHRTSVKKGFYEPPVIMDKVAAKIALIHSEGTEVLEALRKSKGKEAVTEEIADIIIRTLDLHDWLVELGMATDDLDEIMEMKMDKNDARPPKHGHVWG